MIKDIVVNLSVGEKADPACDYAVSVAAASVAGDRRSTVAAGIKWDGASPMTCV